jgi:hypothetical protein
MSRIVKRECFKGYYLITTLGCSNEDHLQSYIDRFENEYLYKLLGKDITEQLYNDLVDGVPQSTEILEWFNPFYEELSDCNSCEVKVYNSDGVKDMLTGLIYYEYVRNNQVRMTPTGLVVDENTNSNMLDFLAVERVAEQRYNKAIMTFKAIATKLEICNVNYGVKFLDIV